LVTYLFIIILSMLSLKSFWKSRPNNLRSIFATKGSSMFQSEDTLKIATD
jgi:hypothetical protein